MKFTLGNFVICVVSACILFGLPYVGVAMAAVLVPVMIISGILSYLSRPKEVKNFEKKAAYVAKDFFSEINETLDEWVDEKEKEKKREYLRRKLEELDSK